MKPKSKFMQQLEETGLMKNRYKHIGKYKCDRIIFNVAMFTIFIFLFLVAWSYDFNLDYYNCIEGADKPMELGAGLECKNPFYEPTTWKNYEYLYEGEYGTKPGALFKSVYYVPLVLLIIALLINHFLYNKKFKFNIKGGDIFK